jgi:lysophospholipase L1-like esterase
MNAGKCPPTLTIDGIHMTDVGYHLLGDLVYKTYKNIYKSKIIN